MQQTNKLIVPIAIIIAGALIAAGIYFSGQSNLSGNTKSKGVKGIVEDALAKPDAPEIDVVPVTSADHIKGSPDATVKVIVYTDTECPFCKVYHNTLGLMLNDYTGNNKVALVYRHFPLDMHTKAPKEAEATECAAEIGGSDMFWKYIDMIFANTPANNKLDSQELYNFADKLNIDSSAFRTCLDSGKYASKINEAKANGFKAGARGTPYTVLAVTKSGKTEFVPLVDSEGNGLGALQYASLKKVVDKLLN